MAIEGKFSFNFQFDIDNLWAFGARYMKFCMKVGHEHSYDFLLRPV
jgi:hypothetical protein